MVFTRGLLLQLALTIEEIHGGILRKVFFAHVTACGFTGWMYRKSVFQGEVTIATKYSPTQLYLLLNALHGFLLPDFPGRCDAVQQSRDAALFLLPSFLLLVRPEAFLLPPTVT